MIWVLAPHLESDDANISYYYDFTQSIAEYTTVFTALNMVWRWQPVTMQNYAAIVQDIQKQSGDLWPIVLNLCDGDEINGVPGISVIDALQKAGLPYTGADQHFYRITTSKLPMKLAFDTASVPTPAWKAIHHPTDNIESVFESMGSPLIIKPAISGGSMGVGTKNVVHNLAELKIQVEQMFQGYRGWDLAGDGLLLEAFIKGREFTTFIVGDADHPNDCLVYPAIERVFHASLPEEERFLSFDRLWEIYEEESPMPNEENFYEYALAPDALQATLKQLTLDAYIAVGGKGYARLDIRMDAAGNCYVLEVNAQCGLSADENYTSIGAILRFAASSFTNLIQEIIQRTLSAKDIRLHNA
jgi:D-alanine-D-alanine ligase